MLIFVNATLPYLSHHKLRAFGLNSRPAKAPDIDRATSWRNYKFGVAILVLATALSTAAYAAPKGGGGASGGGGHAPVVVAMLGGGGGGMRGWRWYACRGGRWRASHQRQAGDIPRKAARPSSRVKRAERARHRSLAAHNPSTNSASQRTLLNSTGNETRRANAHRKHQISRRAQHVELPLGRRRIAQHERITQSAKPRPHHRERGDGGMA